MTGLRLRSIGKSQLETRLSKRVINFELWLPGGELRVNIFLSFGEGSKSLVYGAFSELDLAHRKVARRVNVSDVAGYKYQPDSR